MVRDRGFVIGAGQEVFVGVDGSDVYSTLDAKTVEPIKRKCYFHQERALDYYANYTRSNCLLECSFKFIKSVCQCVPYFYPSMYFITVASHAMFAKIIIVSLLNHREPQRRCLFTALHGQVSSQPKRCHSAMLDPKGRAFRCVSGSL